MGISGMMRTSVSGMNAQSTRLSTVADNVANSSTVGYKRADSQFSTMVAAAGRNFYESGGVNTHMRYDISKQGNSRVTTRPGDAMINGNGFFRVEDSNGGEFMTRSGSFERDKDGFLQNAAGFFLLGKNGQRIQVKGGATDLIPPEVTTLIDAGINLKSDGKPFEADWQGIDPENPLSFHEKKSVTTYDSQGGEVILDIYFAKVADNEWKMAVYKGKTAVTSNPVDVKFDREGYLTGTPDKVELTLQGPANSTYKIDLVLGTGSEKRVTQQGSVSAFVMKADGMKTGYYTGFTFTANGDVMVSFSNGKNISMGVAGLATVEAPERLSIISGTVFQSNGETGTLLTGRAGEGLFGSLKTGVLEESNADIADELTNMIEAQRSYTANSKVFQTGSELMDVLVNLKR